MYVRTHPLPVELFETLSRISSSKSQFDERTSIWLTILEFIDISRKDVDSIKKAMQRKHISVTDVLDTGMTPIAFALRHFSLPMVQFLLQEGADLFQEGPFGVTPPGFMMALEKLYSDPNMPTSERRILEELLPMDTLIEMAGLSPLHKVVLGINCLDLGELLRLNVCPVDQLDFSGRTALQWAAAKGDATAINHLLEAGAQLECQTRLRSETPLLVACRTGANPEGVRALLAAGADINAVDCYGQTALILAVASPGGRNRIEIAAALLEAGADVNKEQGYAVATPLAYACVGSCIEMVNFLISAGANIEHRDRDGSTILSENPDAPRRLPIFCFSTRF
jgi:ankyrin repeat protein